MARSIITAQPEATSPKTRGAPVGKSLPEPVPDGYSDALLKLIPVEIIGLYLSMIAGASASIGNETASEIAIQIGFFITGALLTYFYLKVYMKVSNTRQVIISVGAFCIWAMAINSAGPHPLTPGWLTGYLVLVYTFIAPKIPLESKRN